MSGIVPFLVTFFFHVSQNALKANGHNLDKLYSEHVLHRGSSVWVSPDCAHVAHLRHAGGPCPGLHVTRLRDLATWRVSPPSEAACLVTSLAWAGAGAVVVVAWQDPAWQSLLVTRCSAKQPATCTLVRTYHNGFTSHNTQQTLLTFPNTFTYL